MKRLRLVLVLLPLVLPSARLASAQMPDPLHIGFNTDGTPAALEGSYRTDGGQLQFLALGSPRDCNDGSDPSCPNSLRVYFYNEACNRTNDIPVALAPNAVTLLPLHNGAVTPNRAGNFLVAAESAAQPGVPRRAAHALMGMSYFIDPNLGIARIQELARLAQSGQGWLPYQVAGLLLFAPPDDGAIFTDTLLLRCPTGVTLTPFPNLLFGTAGTLGGDMLEVGKQANGGAPGGLTVANTDAIRNRGDIEDGFAASLFAIVFDTNGNLVAAASFPCQCLTERRLSSIVPAAATMATNWEILGLAATGKAGVYAGVFDLRVQVSGAVLDLTHRLHHAAFVESILQ